MFNEIRSLGTLRGDTSILQELVIAVGSSIVGQYQEARRGTNP